jgi:hypothetical protein
MQSVIGGLKMNVKSCLEVGEGVLLLDILCNVANGTSSEVRFLVSCLRAGVFNAWPAGHMWPAEPFAVARQPF